MSTLQLPRSRENGFTLIEMMITLVVVLVLVAIGLPSFSSSMRSNNAIAQANALLATFNLARAEAIRTNGAAAVCTTANPSAGNAATCGGGGTWNTGWMVVDCADPACAGTTPVRVYAGNSSVNIVPAGGLATPIIFNSQALPTTAIVAYPTAALVITPIGCRTGTVGVVHSFFLNNVGQFRMQNGNC